jgi:hypothetical protein
VSLKELKQSIGAYFWSVINLFFVLWIADLLLSPLLRSDAGLALLVLLAKFIILNAAPEVIYVRGSYGGIETIKRSVSFLQQNWIEWYLPNLLMGGLLYAADRFLAIPELVFAIVAGAFIHWAMIFRGHLFLALDGSSHRQRVFKYRNAA